MRPNLSQRTRLSIISISLVLALLGSAPAASGIAGLACGFDDLDCSNVQFAPCTLTDLTCMDAQGICFGDVYTSVGLSANLDIRNQLDVREFHYPSHQNPDFVQDCSTLETGDPFDQDYNLVELVGRVITVYSFAGHGENPPQDEMVIYECLNNGAGEPCAASTGTYQGPSWPAESKFANDSDALSISYCDAPRDQFCNDFQGSTHGTIDLYNDANIAWCVNFHYGTPVAGCDANFGHDFGQISISWVHDSEGLGGGMTRGYAPAPGV